jgi:predicted ATPase/class 3 adenylate cyclase
MPELLTGTVTFLFSDIEGSTRLLQEHGEAWPALLARHHELLESAFEAHGGQVVGTEGDSFFVGFPSAPAGVAAAAAAQRSLAAEPWPPKAEVRVRIGLHTGEASLSTDTYVGLHVHRAARIAGVARGGQVLISATTRALLDPEPPGIELRDLGEHRLKDLDRPEHLFQLVIDGLPSEFPPIGSAEATPNNLPTRLTTFLGREAEIAEAMALLGSARLLTLTGPGGTGKTRLSLEIASRSLAGHPDGAYFVELATITEPDLVPSTITQSLGLADRGGRSSIDRLVDHIGDGRVLLVLDNFEQVLPAAAAVTQLLAACPGLTILASSRSALHVSGEQEYAVPPLGLPDPGHLPPLSQLSAYEAVALFIERARAIRPDFAVTNENAPAVAEICVRLDGLPLAIELAAARIRIFTPQAMLARLDHRLGLLSAGARDLPERQQTLRGAIAWSHDMLDVVDRALFACISVFVGSAGLDEIEGVCSSAVGDDLFGALESLVEKSLVRQVEGIGGEPRFAMLETIREFAAEQAAERGERDGLRQRHAELFTERASTAQAYLMGSDKRGWLDRIAQDHDNYRAALTWAIETGAAETAMRLGAALWRFWQMRGHLVEGMERLQAALDLPHAVDHPEARADALSAAAGVAYWQADGDRSRALYEQEIEVRRQLGDRRGLAEALYSISFTWSLFSYRDPDTAVSAHAYVSEALELFAELDDEAGVARCRWALANAAYGTGDVEAARVYLAPALETFRRLDDSFMVGWTTYTGALADLSEDFELGNTRPDLRARARTWLDESLRIFADADDVSGYTLVIDALALVAFRDGDVARAARLSGAVARLELTSGTGLNLWNRELLGFDPAALREDPALADAWLEGEAMDAAELVAHALGDPGRGV